MPDELYARDTGTLSASSITKESHIVLHHGDYRAVLNHVCADLIFTSPPYNIGSTSKRRDGFRKLGLYDPRSFTGVDGYADSLPEDQYQADQIKFLSWCYDHLMENGTIVYNHKLRRRNKQIIHPMQWILKVPGLVLADEVVWDRFSGHNHDPTMMWPQTERLFVLRKTKGTYSLSNTRNLPQRSDIWRIGRERNKGHCAPFPVALAEAVILAWSAPGQLVVDPYTGSGSAAVAAKRLGRRFEGAEILKKYHDMALRRIV